MSNRHLYGTDAQWNSSNGNRMACRYFNPKNRLAWDIPSLTKHPQHMLKSKKSKIRKPKLLRGKI